LSDSEQENDEVEGDDAGMVYTTSTEFILNHSAIESENVNPGPSDNVCTGPPEQVSPDLSDNVLLCPINNVSPGPTDNVIVFTGLSDNGSPDNISPGASDNVSTGASDNESTGASDSALSGLSDDAPSGLSDGPTDTASSSPMEVTVTIETPEPRLNEPSMDGTEDIGLRTPRVDHSRDILIPNEQSDDEEITGM